MALVFQIVVAPTLSWKVLIYANGLFVALADNASTVNIIMTSPDGINWTQRTTPAVAANEFRALIYDGSEFIAFYKTSRKEILYSVDGITWLQRAVNDWLSAYGAGYGVGVYVTARGYTQYSVDGVNWPVVVPALGLKTEKIDYINSIFVATGGDGTGLAAGYIGVSADGVNWVTRAIPLTSLGRVAYGNGVYVLTRGRNPGSDQVMVSSDLITWNIHSVGLGSTLWNDITFDNGLFVMTANDVSGTKVASSFDGIVWTAITIVGDAFGKVWKGITGNGSGLYAMVNENGDAAYAIVDSGINVPLMRRRRALNSSGV